jgi:hypothetical protein
MLNPTSDAHGKSGPLVLLNSRLYIWEVPTVSSSYLITCQNGSKNPGKYFTYCYPFFITDTTQEQPNRAMHRAKYKGGVWSLHVFSGCATVQHFNGFTNQEALWIFFFFFFLVEDSLLCRPDWWNLCTLVITLVSSCSLLSPGVRVGLKVPTLKSCLSLSGDQLIWSYPGIPNYL